MNIEKRTEKRGFQKTIIEKNVISIDIFLTLCYFINNELPGHSGNFFEVIC